jgi:hypothetical protein
MKRAVSDALLSLSEVTSLGEPALFLDWGETLLFRDGALFDLHGTVDELAAADPPEELPGEILAAGVGIEYGWHHLAGCECLACAYRSAA